MTPNLQMIRVLVFVSLAGLMLVALYGNAVHGSQGTVDDPVATVTYCELLKDPKRFHNKVVRINAVFKHDFEQSFLSDEEGCTTKKAGYAPSDTWVNHDKSFVMDGESDEAKTNRTVSGFGKWRLTAVGRFRRAEGSQRFGHLGCCRYQFALIRIEKSEKL